MNRLRQGFLYLVLDMLASFGVWLLFFLIRRYLIETETFEIYDRKSFDQLVPALIIAIYWVIIYAITGLYADAYRKSRFKELQQIFSSTLIGVLVIFFTIFINDMVKDVSTFRFYIYYYVLQVIFISAIHLIITSRTNRKLRRRILGFPTLIIGNGPAAEAIVKELNSMKRSLGYDIQGYISLPASGENVFFGKMKRFGVLADLLEVIQKRRIEEVIIALEPEDKDRLLEIVDMLEGTSAKVKIVPGIYDFILGRVRTTHIMGSPLVEIFPRLLSPAESFFKRAFDIVVALIALILTAPLFLLLSIAIKLDSRGPIFFTQERIGKGGKPFRIIKFRTMRTDAEKMGPALSSENDPRITRTGRFMRKTRLDEFPQFWNVLRGDMSFVGPRPERQFFIDQIVKVAPHYRHLHRVRPGITSWGQVKFGYAQNVDEMVERLKYDILYIENMSLALDFKIIAYTVIVMVEGRGK